MAIDLMWGESVAVREAFISEINKVTFLSRSDLFKMDYTPFEGNARLIELTKEVIRRQTGKDYKHVLLTNGAAGGVTIALRMYQKMGHGTCITDKAPYFSLYPAMIRAAGLNHLEGIDPMLAWNPVRLIDSPRNPTGKMRYYKIEDVKWDMPVIWDAVYHSGVYMPGFSPVFPEHHIHVASYSKLTGLNGIRVGWIATDDDFLYYKMADLVTAEYCGISGPSTDLLLQILPNYDWDTFEKLARFYLNDNRAEWSKLTKFFGDEEVPNIGMFYYGPTDKHCKKLLEKAGITYSPGSKLWHSDDYGRFNIGQSREIIKQAVQAVLKADKI